MGQSEKGEETITPPEAAVGQCEKMVSKKGFSFPGNVLSGADGKIEGRMERRNLILFQIFWSGCFCSEQIFI